jgi:cysteinylglycine-S-conjugate dipeptidase
VPSGIPRYLPVSRLIAGAEDSHSHAHASNEPIHLGDFRNGILAEALLLARLNRPA